MTDSLMRLLEDLVYEVHHTGDLDKWIDTALPIWATQITEVVQRRAEPGTPDPAATAQGAALPATVRHAR